MGSEDKENEFGVSQKIMLAAIVSFLAAAFLILLLYLYSRYLVRLEERRRNANLYRLTRQIRPDVTEHRQPGLDPLVIASIPPIGFKPSYQPDHGNPLDCSICLGTMAENVMVRVLPNCKHVFHVECIDMWLGSHTNCPICRTVVQPILPPEQPKGQDQSAQIQPSAPPMEEGSVHACPQLEKVSGSGSRLGSFRRLFTGERSSRTRSCGDEICLEDLERQ